MLILQINALPLGYAAIINHTFALVSLFVDDFSRIALFAPLLLAMKAGRIPKVAKVDMLS